MLLSFLLNIKLSAFLFFLGVPDQILTSIILWVASILSINTFSNHDILGERKVDGESSTLTHANLFFSTWTAVLYSFLLATSWFDASVTSADWVLMFVVSCALMGASVAYIQDTGLEGEKWKVDVLAELYGCDDVAGGCKRVAFGFYLGLISGFLSLVMIVLHRLGPGFHFILGIVVLCGWGGGVGIITFASVSERIDREYIDHHTVRSLTQFIIHWCISRISPLRSKGSWNCSRNYVLLVLDWAILFARYYNVEFSATSTGNGKEKANQ